MMPRSAIAILLLAATTAHAGPPVEDGDTWSVRLAGIDAPESGQPCPVDAAGALSELLAGKVTCETVGVSGTRIVQRCWVLEGDVGRILVRRGLAFDDPRYPPDYAAAERRARKADRGVWRHGCQRPWVWRR